MAVFRFPSRVPYYRPAVLAPSRNSVDALEAVGVSTGAPSVGTPSMAATHALTATGVDTGAPSVGTPSIGQTHVLTASGVDVGAPSVGTPSIGQTHVLTATGVSTGAPTITLPVCDDIPRDCRDFIYTLTLTTEDSRDLPLLDDCLELLDLATSCSLSVGVS